MADKKLWKGVDQVRAAVSGGGLDPVWDSFDGKLVTHQSTLLALAHAERVALLSKPEEYSYGRVAFMREVAALAHAWMQQRERAGDAERHALGPGLGRTGSRMSRRR